MNEANVSAGELISLLARQIDDTLKPLIPYGASCALLEFPHYSNSGDSAIWLGERKWLRQNGNDVVYTCNKENYSKEILERSIKDGIILLQGGGNFGDLWKDHQQFRERIIGDFPNNKIIQLPQTIHFGDKESLKRTTQVLNAHPDLTLLCRDKQTLDLANKEFSTKNILCPDMAFALGKVERPVQAKYEVVWLSRTDKESGNAARPVSDDVIKRTDWLEEPFSSLNQQYEKVLKEAENYPQKWGELFDSIINLCNAQAEERFLRGCTILSEGKMVITDRLHAHILSLLLGIPHIILDNNYGKIKTFYEAWTKSNELTRWASSVDDIFTWLDDKDFRYLLQTNGVDLEGVKAALNNIQWTTPEEDTRNEWAAQVAEAKEELLNFLAKDERLLLVDEDLIRTDLGLNGFVVPFSEKDGVYWGSPADSEEAISLLAQRRKDGFRFLAFAWPSFWWLDHYEEFTSYLHQNFSCVTKNSRLVLFDLGRGA